MAISEQLDLLGLLEERKLELPAPSLYVSPTRGVRARAAEFAAWKAEHGSFGCFARSHAWHLELTLTDDENIQTDRCQATVLQADLRCDDSSHDHGRRCSCVGDLVARGACLGCVWEGPAQGSVSLAVADAHDHAWPGWRDLPIVPRPPERGTSKRELAPMMTWQALVEAGYPDGWLADGGPIVTRRGEYQTRDVPAATSFGGYDISARESNLAAGEVTSR